MCLVVTSVYRYHIQKEQFSKRTHCDALIPNSKSIEQNYLYQRLYKTSQTNQINIQCAPGIDILPVINHFYCMFYEFF